MLKSFAQSRGFIFIDPDELRAAKSWLIKHQRDDGSFPAMGRILNKDLQVRIALISVKRGGGMLFTSCNDCSSGRAASTVTERLLVKLLLHPSVSLCS